MDRRKPIAADPRRGGRYNATRWSEADGACPRGYPCVHRGVDLPAPQGAFVTSPAPGVVTEVEVANAPPWTGYAPVVVIRSDDGWMHLLAHVSGMVIPGQRVRAGQVVAVVGSLRHVHWEVRRRRTGPEVADLVVDPRDWLEGYAGANDAPATIVRNAGQNTGGLGWLTLLALVLWRPRSSNRRRRTR